MDDLTYIHIRIPSKLKDQLKKQADQEMTTASAIVRKAIKFYINGEGVNQ